MGSFPLPFLLSVLQPWQHGVVAGGALSRLMVQALAGMLLRQGFSKNFHVRHWLECSQSGHKRSKIPVLAVHQASDEGGDRTYT